MVHKCMRFEILVTYNNYSLTPRAEHKRGQGVQIEGHYNFLSNGVPLFPVMSFFI